VDQRRGVREAPTEEQDKEGRARRGRLLASPFLWIRARPARLIPSSTTIFQSLILEASAAKTAPFGCTTSGLENPFLAKPIWTEQDDADIGYGEEVSQDACSFLAEIEKLYPPKQAEEIWPHWSDGVPNRFRRQVLGDWFSSGGVRHRPSAYWISLELEWIGPYSLAQLRDKPQYLPGDYTSQWSGVYRVFARDTAVDRCCGNDPTGTLYVGCAASRGRNWSILRTRIQSILRGDHHAIARWSFSEVLHQKFPRETPAIEWAYTGTRVDYTGKSVPNVLLAEGWLLSSYNDSYVG
jgi:hypothetical protein